MSIKTEIERLQANRNTIRKKMTDFGVSSSTDNLNTISTQINNIPNVGAINGTISTKAESYTIPNGYHNGSGKVQISTSEQAKIIPSNIKQGVSILGVSGTMANEMHALGIVTGSATETIPNWLNSLQGNQYKAVSAIVEGFSDLPSAGYYWILAPIGSVGTVRVQKVEASSSVTGAIYVRDINGAIGGWATDDWKKIYDECHKPTPADIGAVANTETISVAHGGTGKTTFISGAALIGNGANAVTTRGITNNTSTSTAISASTNLVTANTLRYAINRTSSVAAANTSYGTYMARGIALWASEITPTVNGAIAFLYE